MATAEVKEDRKNKSIALIVTLLVHALLLLFLIMYIIITPLPPYKLIPTPEVVVFENDFGNGTEGTGHVENDKMGENLNADKVKATTSPAAVKQSAPVITNDAEDANIKTPKNTSKTAVKIDTASADKPQVSVPLASALNKFRHAKGQSAGGDGSSGTNGNAGNPDGTLPGESMGNGPIGYFLKGRKIVTRPNIKSNTQDEGQVVVMIIVDQNGNVIKATPGAQGSNTTSPVLYEKAKEAALSTKFSASPDGTPEQQGKMTIIFSVQ
ncbi:MAG TPA: hypothetical protein VK783_06780 [Bacteroidia bacterium]|nr:hypothetical protein [Bacteroidia bacterium]